MDTEDWDSFGDNYNLYITHINEKLDFNNDHLNEMMFKENLDKWSKCYPKMSYMKFRHEVKEIASRNHAKLGIKTKFGKDMFEFNGSDDIYLATDDDDWFNPVVVDRVMALFEKYPNIDLVYWPSWQYCTTFFQEEFKLFNDDHVSMGSNGLAIRGRYPEIMCRWGIHELANEVVPMHKRLYYETDEVLSIWNIHPASFWQRSNFPLSDQIYNILHTQRPETMNWASEEINEMYKLVISIKTFDWYGKDLVHLL